MKLVVNTPMMSEKITELLCGYRENGMEFKFVRKTGMRLEFEVNSLDGPTVSSLVKNLIRSTDYGKVLYFSVEVV